jgi:prolyl-tRNA synthetase
MAGKTPEGRLVYFLVPGDRELNPVKAGWAVPDVELLDEDDFASFGIPKGSLGPVDPPSDTLLIADASLRDDVAWGIGANENDYHLIYAQPGHDFEVGQWADLVLAQAGDRCPVCGGVLQGARGIEVSQVFQLGTKYSDSMGATFADENGDEQPFLMGCYGVGVSRTLAAVIEQHSDEAGIIWPISVAPLEVAVLPLMAEGEVAEVAERLWSELAEAGVETVIDDRDERAGVKFNDADLLGWPFQLIVGKRGLAEGVVELKTRETGERVQVPLDGAAVAVADLIVERRSRFVDEDCR